MAVAATAAAAIAAAAAAIAAAAAAIAAAAAMAALPFVAATASAAAPPAHVALAAATAHLAQAALCGRRRGTNVLADRPCYSWERRHPSCHRNRLPPSRSSVPTPAPPTSWHMPLTV